MSSVTKYGPTPEWIGLRGDTMYETSSDIEQKLTGTIILYDGKPVYIKGHHYFPGEEDTPGLEVKIIPIQKGSKLIRINDPKLDFRGISERLGYVNLDNDCMYLHRMAVRKSIQGVRQENLWMSISVAGLYQFPDFTKIAFTDAFVNMVDNCYPNLAEARIDILAEKRMATAISRDFAVGRSRITYEEKNVIPAKEPFCLEFKGLLVAFSTDLKTFHVEEGCEFVEEIMDHYGLKRA